MKVRQIAIFLIAVILLTAVPVSAQETSNVWKEFYVAVDGNDANDGSKEAPFASIKRAQEAVREVSEGMQGDIVVNIAGGEYFLDATLCFGPEDSGKNGHQVIYKGEEGNMPLISGGRRISGFVPSSKYPGVYQISLEGRDRLNALYVNGVRRYMAKATTVATGLKKPEKYDNEDWYKAHPNDNNGDSYNWYDPETPYRYDGMYMSKEDIGFYENQEDIIFMWNEGWKTYTIPVDEIIPDPDSADRVLVRMEEGLWDEAQRSNAAGTRNYPRPEKQFIVMNAMELLDEPGEFYFNRATDTLYYMPYDDEDMATADVIIPEVEFLMLIEGQGVENKVENITFKGLQLSHNTWNDWELGLISTQASTTKTTSGSLATYIYPQSTGSTAAIPGAVVMQMTNNVDFIGNNFRNIGSAALDLANGVENADIEGNAFSDIGEGAIFLGSSIHADAVLGKEGVSAAPAGNVGELCLNKLLYHKVYHSYYSNWDSKSGSGYGADILSGQEDSLYATNDQFETWLGEYRYNGAWKSDPNAPAKGEKSWVMWDFLKPYTMSKITLAFDPEYVTEAEKSGFEVLVSNDKQFREGNYEVVATQTSPANEVQEYTVNLDGKYQYVMVRTLGATPLAISRSWVFTPDVKPYTKYQRCINNNITNNYIERYGVDIPRATGIMAYFTENTNIVHNEVVNGGYTGIAFGWGWSRFMAGSRNVDCSYNYVHNVAKLLHDGGAIYTLSLNENSTITNNYIDGVNLGINGIYTDNGTSDVLVEKNVVENAITVISPYADDIRGNTYVTNYATHQTIGLSANGRVYNRVEDPIVYAPAQPPKEVMAIKENAGIEDKYEHIKNWVIDVDNNLHDQKILYDVSLHNYERKKGGTLTEAKAMIDKTVYGNRLGEVPIEYKLKIQTAQSDFAGASSSQRHAKLITLENVIREAKEAINRYSLKETIELCKKTAAEAKPITDTDKSMGLFPQKSIDEFNKQIADIEARAEQCKSKEDEFDILLAAEKAYNDFVTNRLSADVASAYSKVAKDVSIDKENAEIKFILPKDADIKKIDFELEPEGSAEVAVVLKKTYNLSKPVVIPVYCKEGDQYKYWKISAEYETGAEKDSIFVANWHTKSNLKNAVKNGKAGVTLSASPYVYMSDYKSDASKVTEFRFAPMSNNDIKTFAFIIGADVFDEMDVNDAAAINDRCEVVFNDTEAQLCTIKNGVRKVIATTDTSIRYNKENTFSYTMQKVNNSTLVKIKLNGDVIFSKVMNLTTSGTYFGYYSNKVSTRLY